MDMTWLQRSMLDMYACVAAVAVGTLGLLGWVLLWLVAQVQRWQPGHAATKPKAQ